MPDLGQIVVDLSKEEISGLYRLLAVLSYIAGLMLIAMSIIRLRRVQSAAQFRAEHQWGAVLTTGIAGITLIALPQALDVFTGSMGETEFETRNSLAYVSSLPGTSLLTDRGEEILGAVLVIIEAVGVIFFFKGIFSIERTARGGGAAAYSYSNGIWQMVGGVICANIGFFLSATSQSLNFV